ncbi:MAG: hypothetical protein AAGG44_15860 [Planctomycetota bacterium]
MSSSPHDPDTGDPPSVDHWSVEVDPLIRARDLLNQQVWCWGRDILRPEGNWLLNIGFDRIEPPADRADCSSVYSLQLPRGRCVVLRGFGVFYGDRHRGGVFLPRYGFPPRYTKVATLECPPWSDADLPKLSAPNDAQRTACTPLTVDLIDWIWGYEVTIAERLGLEYRRSTLLRWDNGKRHVIPAEEMASAWKELAQRVAVDSSVY